MRIKANLKVLESSEEQLIECLKKMHTKLEELQRIHTKLKRCIQDESMQKVLEQLKKNNTELEEEILILSKMIRSLEKTIKYYNQCESRIYNEYEENRKRNHEIVLDYSNINEIKKLLTELKIF